MAEAEKKSVAAVYVSWTTFKNALDQLSKGELPNLIDKSVFTGMSWSVQNQLFTGLRFLGLTEETGKPTPDLESLVQPSDEAAQKAKLKQILQARYAELFSINLKKATPDELSKKMADVYGMSSDTRDKAMRFFISASQYAGVELSSLLDTGKKNGGTAAPRKRGPQRRRTVPPAPGDSTGTQTPGGTSKTVSLKSGGILTLSATLDLFALNPTDRKFVFELIDKLEAYAGPTDQTKGE